MTCATLRRRSVTYRFVTSTNLNRFASSPSIPSLPSHYLRLRRFNFFFLASLSSTPYSISLVRSHASSRFLSRLIVISPIPTFGVSSEGATFVPGQDVGYLIRSIWTSPSRIEGAETTGETTWTKTPLLLRGQHPHRDHGGQGQQGVQVSPGDQSG